MVVGHARFFCIACKANLSQIKALSRPCKRQGSRETDDHVDNCTGEDFDLVDDPSQADLVPISARGTPAAPAVQRDAQVSLGSASLGY